MADFGPIHSLFLIADNMAKLRVRVSQLLSDFTWAENSQSRTRRLIANVRIGAREGGIVRVRANFVVHRMRFQNTDSYIGEYHYKLQPQADFKIIERRVLLDLEALRPHGKVSFIV